MTDGALTDAWEACSLDRGISHEEHLRISLVLLRRHGRTIATQRNLDGTRRYAATMGVPEVFDKELTRRWAEALADAVEDGDVPEYHSFLAQHPEFGRSDLFGLPAWKRS